MPWQWDVVERDHFIQNPTSAEKIRLLGDYLRLTSQSRVLDIACGKGGPGDAALCLGAGFVWGTIADAAAALAPATRRGGFVAIGEPYWRQWPLPDGIDDEGWVDVHATVKRFERAGLATTGIIAASDDDWDRYESLHWRAVEEWLSEHPDDEFRTRHERHRNDYFAFQRALLGWAIFVGRKA